MPLNQDGGAGDDPGSTPTGPERGPERGPSGDPQPDPGGELPNPKRDGIVDPGGAVPSPKRPRVPTPPPRRRAATPPGGTVTPTTELPPPSPPTAPPIPPPAASPHRTDTYIPTDQPIPVVYGTVSGVGAQLVYERVQPDGSKVVKWNYCHGPIQAVASQMVAGTALSAYPGITSNVHLGTKTQTADSILSVAEPTWNNGQPGIASGVAKFPAPSITNSAPDVRNHLTDLSGMLIRDPRTDSSLVTRYFRENVALVLADLLSSRRFGGSVLDTNIDWAGTFTDEANACDVLLADGITKRFTIGIWISKYDPETLLQNICDHAQLNLVCNSGFYQVWMDRARPSSGLVFTDQGAGANIINCSPLKVAGAKQVPTRVRVNYVNSAASWKDDFAVDEDPGIASGAVEIVELILDLKGIRYYDHAKRIARYTRKARARDDKTGVMRVMSEGSQLLPGTRINVTSTVWNWSNQDAYVMDVAPVPDSLAWDVTVAIYDPSVYDDTQATTTSLAAPAVASPYGTPPEVVTPNGDAHLPSGIYWSAPVDGSGNPWPFVKHYNVYDKRSGTRRFFDTYPGPGVPTSSHPFDVSAITTTVVSAYNVGGSGNINIDVTVVSVEGIESAGVNINTAYAFSASGGIAPSVPQAQGTLTLVSGLNSDIPADTSKDLFYATGPTAAASVGGFGNTGAGRLLAVYFDFAQAVTIVNEDGSSTPSYRLKTGTGGNIALKGPCVALFLYVGTIGRWSLLYYGDGSISLNAGKYTFAGNPEIATAAANAALVLSESGVTAKATVQESGGNAYLSSNAQRDTAGNWNRFDTTLPAWNLGLSQSSDVMLLRRAAAGANPITWSTFLTFSNTGLAGFGATPSGAGFLQTATGSASRLAKAGGAIFVSSATTGNSAGTETDIRTVTLEAGVLGTDGDSVTVTAGGTIANTGSTNKRLRAYFGGTSILDTGPTSLLADTWRMVLDITRASSSSVKCVMTLTFGSGFFSVPQYTSVTGLTLSNTQVLKITGNGSFASDVVAEVWKGHWSSAP
jgi:hypothetical protein